MQPTATATPADAPRHQEHADPGSAEQLVLLGFLAAVLVAVGARLGAPLPGPATPPRAPGGWAACWVIAYYVGLVLLLRVWLQLVALATAVPPRVPPALLLAAFALWSAPLAIGAPLFSRDVYSYAAQAEMVSRGLNPYEAGPLALGTSPYLAAVDPLWRGTPAPYGPLFLAAIGLLPPLAGHQPGATVLALRALAFLGVALLALFLPRLARARGGRPAGALALGLLNPVTLLFLAADAHNEALMLGLLVAGLALASERPRSCLAIVLVAAAAAIKLPAALALPFLGWHRPGPGAPAARRWRAALGAGVAGAAVMAALAYLTGLGWGWVGALGTPGTVRSLLAPSTALGLALGHATSLLGLEGGVDRVLTLTRLLGLVAGGSAVAVLLTRSHRAGMARSLGLALLAAALLGPAVHPWYLTWGLIPLAAVASARTRALVVRLSVAASVVAVPGGASILAQAAGMGLPLLALGTLAVLTTLAVRLPTMPAGAPLPPTPTWPSPDPASFQVLRSR